MKNLLCKLLFCGSLLFLQAATQLASYCQETINSCLPKNQYPRISAFWMLPQTIFIQTNLICTAGTKGLHSTFNVDSTLIFKFGQTCPAPLKSNIAIPFQNLAITLQKSECCNNFMSCHPLMSYFSCQFPTNHFIRANPYQYVLARLCIG